MVERQAGGIIDGCTESCLDKLKELDTEKRNPKDNGY
jgi:hypothetical protein